MQSPTEANGENGTVNRATFASMTLFYLSSMDLQAGPSKMQRHENTTRRDEQRPFNYDLVRMSSAIESGSITLPRGQNHAERKEWIRAQLAKLDTL